MKIYRRILGYLRPHRGLFGISIAAMIVYASLDTLSFGLLIPFLNLLFTAESGSAASAFGAIGGWFGDFLEMTLGRVLTGTSDMRALQAVVLILFGVFLIKNVALYIQQYTISMLEGRVTRDLRNHVYAHLLKLDFPYFQRMRAGQILTRLTVDVDQVRTLVTANLAKAMASTIQVVFYLSFLLYLSWELTLVAVLSLPPMIGLWGRFRHRLRVGVLRVLDAVGDVGSQLQETVSGIRLVKASGAEEWESQRFGKLTQSHYKALIRNERWRQFFPPATEMVIGTAILGLLWFGSYLVLEQGTLPAAVFMTCLVLAGRLMSPAKFLGQFPSTVQPGLAAGERIFEILDTPAEVTEASGSVPVEAFRDAIRFEDVGFSYRPGEPVLEGIDFTLRVGEAVALVGPSGAGKSTLADLLPRFHDPTSGRITLDGRDLRELRLTDLRRLMGIVTQETILFHETIRANIAYGREDASQEEVEAAAKAAHAHGFVSDFPEGYDTVVGERGVRLSGGQRQRIAIARALLNNPPILILDEATSALDTESERLVQVAIERLMRDRTVLVIAHRLSTVRRADTILVIDRGRIIERGTHEDLIAREGVYRRLYEMQFTEAAEQLNASPIT